MLFRNGSPGRKAGYCHRRGRRLAGKGVGSGSLLSGGRPGVRDVSRRTRPGSCGGEKARGVVRHRHNVPESSEQGHLPGDPGTEPYSLQKPPQAAGRKEAWL
jgi:hypothetical protein